MAYTSTGAWYETALAVAFPVPYIANKIGAAVISGSGSSSTRPTTATTAQASTIAPPPATSTSLVPMIAVGVGGLVLLYAILKK